MAGKSSGTIPYTSAEPLREALVQALDSGSLHGTAHLLSVQAILHFEADWLFERIAANGVMSCHALWQPGGARHLWVGFGTAAEVSVARGEALTQLSHHFRARLPQWHCANCSVAPRWFGGFAFASEGEGELWGDWPDAKLMLPVFQLDITGQLAEDSHFAALPRSFQAVVTYSRTVQAGDAVEDILRQFEIDFSTWQHATVGPVSQASTPVKSGAAALDETAWINAVRDSAAAIANHELRKVVLARLEVCAEPEGGITEWLPRLCETSGSATAFMVSHGDNRFIGASPERLVRVLDGEVAVDCLAGSRPRGQTSDQDEELGQTLLHSNKDQAEHRVVVDWVRTKLEPLTQSLDLPAVPQLKRMTTVQHLHTPAQGRLYDGVDVLDVAFSLHPTPAVAGDPVDRARGVIARYEPVERGWYAGSVGWVDANGNGEFVVALRSALVQGQQAYLYAGAGIMADSDPLQEWQETGWKLRPMRRVMGCDEELKNHG